MTMGREAVHIGTDLGHDGAGAQLADPGDRDQEGDGGAKGLKVGLDLAIDLGNGDVDGIDVLKVQAQHEAVMVGQPAAQCRFEFGRGRFDPTVSKGCAMLMRPVMLACGVSAG